MNPTSQPGQTELPIKTPTTTTAPESLARLSSNAQTLTTTSSEVTEKHDIATPSSLTATPTPSSQNSITNLSPLNLPNPLRPSRSAQTCCLRISEIHAPPMTPSSLSELDIRAIFHNPKLRHDINYDPYLHFRPNTDGPKGHFKRRHADAYWDMVAEAFMLYHTQGGCSACRRPATIILALFKNLQNILVTLLPPSDQALVVESVDPERILKEIAHRVFRPATLLRWLGSLLKLHCAPMRDNEVDAMTGMAIQAEDQQSVPRLVQTLRRLFDILEMMKLDVANHQIRSFRSALVSGTLDFHSDYYARRIRENRLNPLTAKSWFEDACNDRSDPKEDPVVTLINAIMILVSPSSETTEIPATFECDVERLDSVRYEIREITCLRICLLLFGDLRRRVGVVDFSTDNTEKERLLNEIQDIISDEEERSAKHLRWTEAYEDVAILLTKRALSLAGRTLNADREGLQLVEYAQLFLKNNLFRLSSKLYVTVEEMVLRAVKKSAIELVSKWHSPLDMAVMASSRKAARDAHRVRVMVIRDVDEVARRVAHVSWLHWKVFGRLVYLDGEEDPDQPLL